MNYKVLYRKYRPDNFDNIIGQEYLVTTLKNSIKSGKISHAYIFTGPRGTGKTSTAKVFAKTINCENINDGMPCENCIHCKTFNESQDIIEIDAASNNGVDEIRELRNNVKLAPSNSKYKIYIIDEVHMLSTEAFNALLKTLEEPPQHVIFILATTDIQKVPLTILSRCQRFDFKRIKSETIENYLKKICDKENIKIENDALKEISIICDGGMRDALSILDQVYNGTDIITLDDINNIVGNVSNITIDNLTEALINNNLKQINEILDSLKNKGIDAKLTAEKLIKKLVDMAIYYKFTKFDLNMFEKLKTLIDSLVKGLNDLKNTSNPYLIIMIILADFIKITDESANIEKDDVIKVDVESNKTHANTEKRADEELKTELDEENDFKTDSIEKNDVEIISREIISIRINNCFCKASKEILQKLKKIWSEFLFEINENKKELISLLIDTEIVAASNEYAIIKMDDESQCILFNKNVDKIETYFNNKNKVNYKFVAVTDLEWKKIKNEYINNKKKKVEYKMLEEIKINKEKTAIENTVLDIFKNEKIVIK